AKALRRSWSRRRPARAADAGGAGRVPEGRDRKVVADHQVGRHRRAGAVRGRAMEGRGKTIFITGSTDGVGRYVATTLAGQGAKVLIHGRDAARANAVIADIKRAGGAAPVFYQADLSSLAETRKLAERVLADHNRLDVFVSNAGIGSQN